MFLLDEAYWKHKAGTNEAALAAAQARIARLEGAAGLLARCVSMLNSMVRSGEDHSPTSETEMRAAMDAYRAVLAETAEAG